ncbi:MAG: hypothetical protein ACREBE_00420 [bacterium]
MGNSNDTQEDLYRFRIGGPEPIEQVYVAMLNIQSEFAALAIRLETADYEGISFAARELVAAWRRAYSLVWQLEVPSVRDFEKLLSAQLALRAVGEIVDGLLASALSHAPGPMQELVRRVRVELELALDDGSHALGDGLSTQARNL